MRKKLRVILDKTVKAPLSLMALRCCSCAEKPCGRVFVLRRNPVELRVFMEKSGFQDANCGRI